MSQSHLLVVAEMRTKNSLPDFPYLQVASFNNNNITDTEGISLPLLEYLSLSYNKINRVTGLNASVLSNLHTLELRGNGLTNTDGLAIPTLKNLFLAENFITEITGLEVLTHLTTLHLRDNLVQSLSGYSANMKSLQYVNLRNNKVSDLMEVDKLSCLPRIRALILSECPLAEQEEYRIEVLICLRRLERLDKFEYTEEDRREAEDLYEQRQEREITSENAAGY
ncbi:PREDICTED: leucine-rich repeat-containing protein 23-like [Priapulus caudatus]|uniref:Leucine-rich repeat-containing protein 23-like n=1 Tax=Priapulus caudatus TaxID=37621 RepID=A0ABM1DZV9_PRICU|nr:PREDICTED: leucine-rich repeat-containing protein 23-like [Priapulus caudatus]